jgi:hypothetical protein
MVLFASSSDAGFVPLLPRLNQHTTQNFPYKGLRKFLTKFNVPGDGVFVKTLSAKFDQFLFGEFSARARYNESLYALSLSAPFNAHDSDFHNVAVLIKNFFNVPWINTVFTGHDRVPLTADDLEIAVLVHNRHITGVEPSIS